MTLWAIVPVKPLRRGKSRLAGVLTEEERLGLNSQLLTHTVDILGDIPEIEHVLDLVDPLAASDLGDVQQAVAAGEDVDEGSELGDVHHLAVVYLADLGLGRIADGQDALLGQLKR